MHMLVLFVEPTMSYVRPYQGQPHYQGEADRGTGRAAESVHVKE